MVETLKKLYEVEAQEGEDGLESKEVDDEVFRQQYIPQTLQQVYDIERDGETIRQGAGEPLVYQSLLAESVADGGAVKDPLQGIEAATLGSGEPSGDSDDESDSSDDEDVGEVDGSAQTDQAKDDDRPRGKRFEDKDAKREHKKERGTRPYRSG